MSLSLSVSGIRALYRIVFLCSLALFVGGGCATIPRAASSDRVEQCRRDLALAQQLRGLPVLGDIAIERETPAELRGALLKELEKAENRLFLAETELLLKQLRVLKRGDDLSSIYLRLMSEQVAAYYDPERKRVSYVDGTAGGATNVAAFPGMERFVYVHEFCHAVEDSQFDLERLTLDSTSDFDRSLALTSFVEGSAVLVGLDGLFSEFPMNTATPAGDFTVWLMSRVDMSEAMGEMGECPSFLSGALVRPYVDGGVFVNRLRREAGWGSVDRVYREKIPRTTAEIVYPERRFLSAFEAVDFIPDSRLFEGAAQGGVSTNRLGVMGTALWLGGDSIASAREYAFLSGWMGDRLYLARDGKGGAKETVWFSYWERAGLAKAFCRAAEKRLRECFGSSAWCVTRDGRKVVISLSGDDKAVGATYCERQAKRALEMTQLINEERVAGSFAGWLNDFPWPVRVPCYAGFSSGVEVFGGHVLEVSQGSSFYKACVADGLLLRAESNPDRQYFGTLGGCVRYVTDRRSDYTYWKLPLVVSWHRRGQGESCQYRWRVLWGLAGYGSEEVARVLFVPVWRAR